MKPALNHKDPGCPCGMCKRMRASGLIPVYSEDPDGSTWIQWVNPDPKRNRVHP